jgi:hypothetical protein
MLFPWHILILVDFYTPPTTVLQGKYCKYSLFYTILTQL